MFGRKGVTRVESPTTDETDEATSEGFSLEELGSAYAMAIGQASVDSNVASKAEIDTEDKPSQMVLSEVDHEEMLQAPDVTETDGVPTTPETILEAMLFLGTSNNRPLAVDSLLDLFRGITATELEAAVDSLNVLYRANNRAMVIVRESDGYRLQLVPELHLIRDRFYGKIKETQLTQSAIDCLSLVAYQPGTTREELEKQWNQPAASMLSTLVRKGLLKIEKRPSQSGPGDQSHYFTTDRFLEIIGLKSLDDLPLSEEF